VFFTAQDRTVYLGLLQEYSLHYRLRILGYALMTDHVHLGFALGLPTSNGGRDSIG